MPSAIGRVETAAFFWQIGGGEVDGDTPCRKFVTRVEQRRAHAVLAFLDRRLGQADDGKVRQAGGEVHFDGDRRGVDADLGAGVNDGE